MPPNPIDTKSRLIDVAEQLFAARGIADVSLREITSEADVNLAAVNYHFGSKLGLLRSILLDRGAPLSEERSALLAALTDDAFTVRGIIEAFLHPVFELRARRPHFPRLFARVQMEGLTEELGETFRSMFHNTFVEYSAALHRALPEISLEDIRWRLMLTVGTFHFVLCNEDTIRSVHRDPALDPASTDMAERIISFCEAGIRAPIHNSTAVGGKRDA